MAILFEGAELFAVAIWQRATFTRAWMRGHYLMLTLPDTNYCSKENFD